MTRFNIMDTNYGDPLHAKFFIDCPVDCFRGEEKIVRMQIPQHLAIYVRNLQDKNESLEQENNRMRSSIENATKPSRWFGVKSND